MDPRYGARESTKEVSRNVVSPALSTRGASSLVRSSNHLWTILSNLWDPESNPEGYVTLGVADNALLLDELVQRINKTTDVPKPCMTYNDGPTGSLRCKRAIAHFLNRHPDPFNAIDAMDLVVTNGVSAATEHCSWALCNPGDGVLLGRPYYRSFLKDLGLRPDVRVVPVSFGTEDPLAVSSVTLYERALHTSCEQGVKIKAIVLCNPHNPLGRCYSRDFLIELMKLCQKYCINLISDEIYALSVWRHDPNYEPPVMQPFTSALSINAADIINPALIHVLWGMSKDFGANGLRCGVIVSQGNRDLIECIAGVSIFSYVSGLAEHTVSELLKDGAFTDAYITSNRQVLLEAYEFGAQALDGMGVPYVTTSNAALFIWCDLLTPYLRQRPLRISSATADPRQLWLASGALEKSLDNARVHVGVPDQFGSEQPGWFRLTFSRPRDQLREGLCRIRNVLEGRDESV